jgi:hypothetical protein
MSQPFVILYGEVSWTELQRVHNIHRLIRAFH